jgi:hypothetical protein
MTEEVLFDALPDALNLLSFTLVGFATIDFTAEAVVVLFPTSATLLDCVVTLLFAVRLLEAFDFAGTEVVVEVFRV